MLNVQVCSETMRSEEIKEALLVATFDTVGRTFAELFQQAQKLGEVDPKTLAITVLGMFRGLVLQKSLDENIDVAACDEAMRAMY